MSDHIAFQVEQALSTDERIEESQSHVSVEESQPDVRVEELRQQLNSFYTEYNPNRLEHVDNLVKHVQNGEVTRDELNQLLQEEYGANLLTSLSVVNPATLPHPCRSAPMQDTDGIGKKKMFNRMGLMKNLTNLKVAAFVQYTPLDKQCLKKASATSKLEQSKEAASKGVNMGRKIMKDTGSRTKQSMTYSFLCCLLRCLCVCRH